VEIDPRRVMGKEATVMGTAFWNLSDGELAEIHDAMARRFEDGSLSPVISSELPLAEAATAHRMVLEPGARGKIVLVP
jgi:NADPH2:quinone reductase